MLKTKSLSFVLSMIFSCSLFAQKDFRKGFVVTNQADTIRGMVEFRSNVFNYESCIFKFQDRTQEYFPEDLKAYGYENDKMFSSQIIEGSFVEVLIRGQLSLFKTSSTFIMQKENEIHTLTGGKIKVQIDGETYFKNDNNWKRIVSYLIGDCIENSTVVTDKLSLKEKSLTLVTSQYNNCKGGENLAFKADKPWTRFNFGASISLSMTTLDDHNFYLNEFESSISPTYGLALELSFPRLSENWFLESGVLITNSSFAKSYILYDDLSERRVNSSVDLTNLSIPILVGLKKPINNLGIFVQIGPVYDLYLKNNSNLTSQIIINNEVTSQNSRKAYDINNGSLGYGLGAGIHKSFQKFTSILSLRYFEYNNILSNGDSDVFDLSLEQKRFSLTLILQLK